MKIGAIGCLVAACTIGAAAAPAWADCQEELAQLQGEVQPEGGGISKDGSLAPLEESSTAAEAPATATDGAGGADTANAEGTVVKDGSETPLETDLSGIATSGQEAAAQQDEAAPGQTGDSSAAMSPEAEAALERATAALQAGDEAGCMEAVEEARSL